MQKDWTDKENNGDNIHRVESLWKVYRNRPRLAQNLYLFWLTVTRKL